MGRVSGAASGWQPRARGRHGARVGALTRRGSAALMAPWRGGTPAPLPAAALRCHSGAAVGASLPAASGEAAGCGPGARSRTRALSWAPRCSARPPPLAPASHSQHPSNPLPQTEDFTFDPFPDLPADFGPEVPDEGIDGLLLVSWFSLK